MKKGTFILLALCGNLFFSSGCKDVPCPVALADLAIKILTDLVTDVVIGSPFSLLSLTKNIPDFAQKCGEEVLLRDAGRFSNFVQVNIRNENTGNYVPCQTNDCIGGPFIVDGLGAYQSLEEGYQLTFHEPGAYQVITYTDHYDNEKEWNENNNIDTRMRPRASDEEWSSHGIFITVPPDPDYVKPEGAPRVEIRRVSMRIID